MLIPIKSRDEPDCESNNKDFVLMLFDCSLLVNQCQTADSIHKYTTGLRIHHWGAVKVHKTSELSKLNQFLLQMNQTGF